MRLITRLLARVGRRGSCLLFFGLLDVIYGFSLAVPPPDAKLSASVRFIQAIAPLPAWAALWLAVGVVCLAGAFVDKDRWAFTAAMALKVLWGVTFLAAWLIAGLDRGWLAAAIWLPMAGWVYILSGWREDPFLELRVVERS